MTDSYPRLSQPKPPPHLNNFEVDERASEARALLDNKVLQQALDDVYSGAAASLLNADIGSLTASTAHASMKAVVALRSKLVEYVSDNKMRMKYSKGDRDA